MGDPKGFMNVERRKGTSRPVSERLRDYNEFENLLPEAELRKQASRCMDCGIPFCHWGCPLNNLIPDFNDRVFRGQINEATEALYATNNFPEFTGRVCPAPCEASCVLNIDNIPVTIKSIERFIADNVDMSVPLVAQVAPVRIEHSIAVIGSGPAGLTAAQQLARLGYSVTVFERDDVLGGLLRYGIPDYKLNKQLIERRVDQMRREGVVFVTNTDVGNSLSGKELLTRFDAIVLTIGARRARDLNVPGRELKGVYLAMDFLKQQNRRNGGLEVTEEPILATQKNVVILGGGDTGADCLGTSLRQGAAFVQQIELLPRPPDTRSANNPWPEWPLIMRTSSSHEEGGTRDFGVMTKEILGENGKVRALSAVRVEMKAGKLQEIPGSDFEIPCDLVLLAMGFVGPENNLIEQLGLERDARGNVATKDSCTSVPNIFAAGDVSRGASLVVWAIAEGRQAAAAADAYISNQKQTSKLSECA
ncbi:MAG: glutamate synthase subunit beta [Deltaproteobacteria bacterium]|nr:glutamate synthase subunit beta [Deltaproteobacteria bacterium]